MKRFMHIKTKQLKIMAISSVILIQAVVILLSPSLAYADLFDIGNLGTSSGSLSSGSFDNMFKDMEERYHLDPEALRNMGETMNTSSNKEMVPQMNLFFNPTDPKNGKEITAQAFPLYFSNQSNSLYFTWYLKRKGCDLEKNLDPHSTDESVLQKIALCNSDGLKDANGKVDITINDWKVQAMRRIANGGFAGDQVNYTDNSNDDDGYKAQYGGDKSISEHCYVHNFESGNDYELGSWKDSIWIDGCQHLFPKSNGNETGDGLFGVDEERFWHTDPQDPSTAQNGNKDEANVVGLGQDKFTWNYVLGDQVGAVIEGLSMNATKHKDASMKVMWAFSKNKCVPTGTLQAPISGSVYGNKNPQEMASIPTASMNLNDCVEDNLIDPTQGDQASKFEIQLSASPENPIIDSFSKNKTDNRGSMLKVQSSFATSATKDTEVSFDWRIYANQKQSAVADDAWENITEGLMSAHAVSRTTGSDLSTLSVNLNLDKDTRVNGQNFFDRYFKDDVGYFRINATATENFDIGKKRVGRSSVIIKLVRAQAQIQTHAVDVDADWKLKFVSPTGTDTGLLCEDSMEDRTVCPVVKGQIIGLSFDAEALGFDPSNGSDVAWIINNKPLRCNKAISTDVDCLSGERNFFPVTGDVGEVYTVNMTATNTLSGKSVTLTRVFNIVEPSILVISADASTLWPKYLGQYVDANGNTLNNYSKDIFESFLGKKFTLKGLFYPNSLKNGARVSWVVNGASAQPNDQGLLVIDDAATQGQKTGSMYTVSLQGTYTPSPKIKKAMFDIWGVSIVDAVETDLSRDIQIEMIQGTDEIATGPLEGSKKFFASIITYVPTSIIFFFRLIVTAGLMLFVVGIVFSFVPEQRKM